LCRHHHGVWGQVPMMAHPADKISDDDLKAAQLVIEAATENYELKLKILKQLDTLLAQDVIVATNTSSISITQLAAATQRADKFIGMHFFTLKSLKIYRNRSSWSRNCELDYIKPIILRTAFCLLPLTICDV
jgi:hypothetical protein